MGGGGMDPCRGGEERIHAGVRSGSMQEWVAKD